MKINNRIRSIYITSGISISILVIVGIIYLENSRNQHQYIDAVEHTYQVLSSINFCEKKLIEAEAAQMGFLLTEDNSHKDLFESALPLIDSSLLIIGQLTLDNNEQKVFYFQLNRFVTARVEIMRENMLLKVADLLYFENLRKGQLVMDNCRDYMAKMRRVEERKLQERVEKKNQYQRINQSYFRTTFILAFLICVIAFGVFFRELGIRLTAQQNLKFKINELSNSKKELEEITFAASHDLQEPMRKVRILCTLITKKIGGKIPEADLDIVSRLNKITEQMHGLLNDLVLYTNLLNPHDKLTDINLYDIFKEVYNQVFKNENVEFQLMGKLPVLRGSAIQLKAMVQHLFENVLKFKSPGRELRIVVKYELKQVKDSRYFWELFPVKQYHQVTITDNGIGFDQQYHDKIFGLFQRLHTQSDYPGKGIGLSVARRVMSNHNGSISSTGEKNVGASFILSFPILA